MSRSVLFVCNLNSVRSPMAAALLKVHAGEGWRVDSAGVYEGWLDPFVAAAMEEVNAPLDDHDPKAMVDMEQNVFDHIIALTPEAATEAARRFPEQKIEYWAVENPSSERGDRDAVMKAYRRVREDIRNKIVARFPEIDFTPIP